MEIKLKKILVVLLLVTISGCAFNTSKTDATNSKSMSDLRLGQWTGSIGDENKQTVWHDHFLPNGDLYIIFEEYEDGELMSSKIELCKWNIEGDIEHISTIKTYRNGRLWIPRTSSSTYEEYYKILEITEARIKYKNVRSGKIYQSHKLIKNP